MNAAADTCWCCGHAPWRHEPALTSLFLARRAWGGAPQRTELLTCPRCGLRTYRRGLGDDEAARYYRGYGDDTYVRERGRDEWFYTRRAHEANEAWQDSAPRQAAVRDALLAQSVPLAGCRLLDWGGADGRLVASLPAAHRAVHDLAQLPVVPGVERIDDPAAALAGRWDVLLCAQTLEHVSRPREALAALLPAIRPGGWLYLELPHQPWRDLAGPPLLRRATVALALRSRRVHQLLDLWGTGCRVVFGVLPPLGLVPMREHLHFFTVPSMRALAEGVGLQVLQAGLHPLGMLQLVARRP